MRIELSYKGVGKNRRYFATPMTAGRPRKGAEIVKSRKVFVEAPTRDAAIQGLLDAIGFQPTGSLK